MQQKSELPEGWALTTVADICLSPQYGWTTSAKSEGKLKLLRTTDITSGKIDWESVPFCEKEPENVDKYLLVDGDIVISRAGSVGYSYLIKNPERSVFASYLIRFKPLINEQFMDYFLKSPSYWDTISEKSLGIAVPNINASKLKQIEIPIPPLAEQHRIVSAIEALFTRLDAANEKLDSVLGILKKFRESVLAAACDGKLTEVWRTENQDIESAISLFDNIREEFKKAKQSKSLEPNPEFNCNEIPEKWILTSLDKITSKITSGSRAWKPYYCDNGPGTFILSQNVRPLKLDLLYKFGVNPPEGDPDRKRSEVRNGDILITIAGNTGDVCRVQSDLSQHYVCQSVALVRPLLKELSPFLELYLNSPLHGQLQYKKWVYGDGRPHLKIDHLKATAILLPPLSEQQEIVRRVDALFAFADSVEAKVTAAREKTDKLRQSILAKAFSGQLVETEAEIARKEGRDYETAEVLIERIKAEKRSKEKKQ